MNDTLFHVVEQNAGHIATGETTFEFLQRGGRTEAVEIRNHTELRSRLTQKDFFQFLGALFELQIHQVLLNIGCTSSIHPNFSGSNATVDFHVANGDQEFYVEATVCGLTKEGLNYGNNEWQAVNKLRDALTSCNLLHSDLCLRASGDLRTNLGTDVIKPFKNLLREYSAERIRDIVENHGHGYYLFPWLFSDPPIAEYRYDSWTLVGWLQPALSSTGLGQVFGPSKTDVLDLVTKIRSSLEKKAKQWRRINFGHGTFVIAINVCEFGCDEYDIRKVIFDSPTPSIETESFVDKLSGVSGIIVVGNATLGYEWSAPVRLYRNGNMNIPTCFEFLLQTRQLGDLIGISGDSCAK